MTAVYIFMTAVHLNLNSVRTEGGGRRCMGGSWPLFYLRSVRHDICYLSYRRGGAAPLKYDLPRGPLTKLLLTHIRAGHQILTQETGETMVRLFATKTGRAFTNVNLVHFWGRLMRHTDTKGQDYFPPSTARTMYVELITRWGNNNL